MQLKRNALPARHELKYFINPAELEALFCQNAPEAYALPAGKGNA